MARGSHASPPVSSLPKVSFTKVDDDVSTQPIGVHDSQSRAYGYNDFSEFQRPDSYMRHIEPLESELLKQVEYDMDEQDKEWLDELNLERKKEQLHKISYELFEVVMDRLEKEWFDLTKNIPKNDLALPSEDSTCAICDDAEGENSNAIVFCDGCNLAVHQECYGVPYIPEGQWLCRKCNVSPEIAVSCILCPNEGGAFKQTVHGEWVHLLCAIWIPETRIANEVFMEPVTGADTIPRNRQTLKCKLCDGRRGACIQCASRHCFSAFHVTCARKERLLLPMKAAQGAEPVTLVSYCDKHLPQAYQEIRAAALAADKALEDSPSHNVKLAKTARAYAKTYKPGPPLVPAIIVKRIDTYTRKFKMSKRIATIQLICRYWSLKREARRGAPLLKRLHLEPWTASAGGKMQTREEKVMKLDQMKHLLYDLEGLKDLTFSTKKREKWKLEQVRQICRVLENSLFVYEKRLRDAFDRITALDRQDHFKNPVNKVEVPDYFEVIETPMCWTMIEGKLERQEYWDIQVFKDDVNLVLNNAILYNKPGTPFQKAALRIQNSIFPIFEELCQLTSSEHHVFDAARGGEDSLALIGDLEPPLELLELLVSTNAINDEIDLVLEDTTPLVSLFDFELPKRKPPPPPLPPPTPPPPRAPKIAKPKRDRRGDNYRKKLERQAAAAAEAAEDVDVEAIDDPIIDQVPVGNVRRASTLRRTKNGMLAAAAKANATANALSEEPLRFSPSQEMITEPVSEGSTTSTKRGRRATDTLPLVEDIDNQQSFLMFNQGWILPAEQKRGGRAPVERQSVSVAPRPRKRMRTDAGPSRLSVVSTAASENRTLELSISAKPDTPEQTPAPSLSPEPQPALPLPSSRTPSPAPENEPESGSLPSPVSSPEPELELGSVLAPSDTSSPEPVSALSPSPVSMRSPEATPSPTSAFSPAPASAPSSSPSSEDEMEVDTSLETFLPAEVPWVSLSASRPKRVPAPHSSTNRELPPPVQVVHLGNGKIVLEELDTPAIRREKSRREKELREQRRAGQADGCVSAPNSSASTALALPNIAGLSVSAGPGRRPRRSRPKKDGGEYTDSVLSDSESEVPLSKATTSAPTKYHRKPRKKGRPTVIPKAPADPEIVMVKDNVEGGSLVWAKTDTYPWWPAVVFEDNDVLVPPNILRAAIDIRQKRKVTIYIVQFFDKQKSWQYLPCEQLRMLGDDKEFDDDMLAVKSLRQKWKSLSSRESCKESYDQALTEMETASDIAAVDVDVPQPMPVE